MERDTYAAIDLLGHTPPDFSDYRHRVSPRAPVRRGRPRPVTSFLLFLPCNWLRVSDTAERSQVDQRIGHQLHAIVPLLDTFKSEQQPLEFIFPCKGPLDTHPQGMDGGVEQPLAPALGGLAVAGGLFDVGDHGRIHNNL